MSSRLFQQAMKSTASSCSSPTGSNPPSDAVPPKVERQIYVPRGRREINESKSKEDEEARKKREEERSKARKEREERAEQERKISNEVQERRRQAFFGDDSNAESSNSSSFSTIKRDREDRRELSRGDHSPALNPPSNPSSSRSRSPLPDFRDHIDDARLAACCVLISGFSSDMSDRAKESEISKFLDAGAVLKWLGPRDCVLIYMNEMQARRALKFSTRSNRYTPTPFSDSRYNDGQNLTSKCIEELMLRIAS